MVYASVVMVYASVVKKKKTWMHALRRMSHTLMFVSKDPEAKKAPYGWKSTT